MTTTTLSNIWAADDDFIDKLIHDHNVAISPNPHVNRITAALFYYNAGLLAIEDRTFVSNPKFIDIMTEAESLWDGLIALQRDHPLVDEYDPIRHKLRVLFVTIITAADAARIAVNVYDDGKSETTTEDLAGGNGWTAAHDAEQLVATVKDVPDHNNPTVLAAAVQAAGTATAAIPGADINTIRAVAVHAAWRTVLAMDAVTQAYVAKRPFVRKNFQLHDILHTLVDTSVQDSAPIMRSFWCYSLWELVQAYPDAKMHAKLDTAITQYGCRDIFALVAAPTTIPVPALIPVVGYLDTFSKVGLAGLISEYVGQPPTRMQALARIMA